LGCGGGSNEPDYAEAFSHVAKDTKEAEAKVHAREHMDKLREGAESEASQARQAAFDALIVVPAEVPDDLVTACQDVAAAFDEFKTPRIDAEEAPRWAAIKARDLEKVDAHCVELGDARVAACQAHALRNAGSEMAADDGTQILTACEDKIGAKVAAGTPASAAARGG
jgi:hypothetical protein